jgi:hypothetical protein
VFYRAKKIKKIDSHSLLPSSQFKKKKKTKQKRTATASWAIRYVGVGFFFFARPVAQAPSAPTSQKAESRILGLGGP